MNAKTRKIFYYTVFAIILLFSIVFTLGATFKNQRLANEKQSITENQAMLERIGVLLNLPDETPIISTVYSNDDFKDASVFSGAEKGDKLIVWVNANQALLYRPSTNTVLQVSTARTSIEAD